MLTFKYLEWNNWFSYGADNHIHFDKEPLTQLVGPNGAGKTSISLILQELLYGKNIKNIKKQDIKNNKVDTPGYSASLIFDKDGDEYNIVLDRKSSLKLKIYKNSEDISSHTALNTYKTIAEIIGIDDFKVFCQLIYQHSTDSLDFLTATDTNRKKFLINLLQLEKYLEYHEKFKAISRDVAKDVSSVQGSISTIDSWIKSHKDMDLIKLDPKPEVKIPDDTLLIIKKLKEDLQNITDINRKINANNQYLKQLRALDSKYYLTSAPAAPNPSSQELRAQVRVIDHQYTAHMAKIKKITELKAVCHECMQEIDEKKKNDMLDYECEERDKAKKKKGKLWELIPAAEELEAEIKKYKTVKEEFEKLSQLVDENLPRTTLSKPELEEKLKYYEVELFEVKRLQAEVQEYNKRVAAHNSKVDVVKSQLDKMNKDLLDKNIELTEHENLLNIIEILKKTFSTNGLVSYKIESSVKELETKINEYLAELTMFRIYFKLSGEKLNIEVVDDLGNSTSISNLSSGERARINISTVLAIRSILSSLTATKINFLMLDEVIGVMDAEGKEKLAEILLRENLNTFIVSHDWTHPLVPKLTIVKENNISRIEDD